MRCAILLFLACASIAPVAAADQTIELKRAPGASKNVTSGGCRTPMVNFSPLVSGTSLVSTKDRKSVV